MRSIAYIINNVGMGSKVHVRILFQRLSSEHKYGIVKKIEKRMKKNEEDISQLEQMETLWSGEPYMVKIFFSYTIDEDLSEENRSELLSQLSALSSTFSSACENFKDERIFFRKCKRGDLVNCLFMNIGRNASILTENAVDFNFNVAIPFKRAKKLPGEVYNQDKDAKEGPEYFRIGQRSVNNVLQDSHALYEVDHGLFSIG